MPLPMFSNNSAKSNTQTIGIASGKGGVGKSTVTVNLARRLNHAGHKVGILDMDIYGPSIRQMLPEQSIPTQKGSKLRPALSSEGISIISMAYFRNAHEASAIRAPIANGIVSQFIEGVAWEPLDYLLIDFPPGTGDVQLTICQKLNLTCALMVTTPQEISLLDVRKAMDLFHNVGVPILGIVENMSYFELRGEKLHLLGNGGGRKLANETNFPLLGEIPIDPLISECGDKGIPLNIDHLAYSNLTQKFQDHLKSLTEVSTSGLNHINLIWKEMDENVTHSKH